MLVVVLHRERVLLAGIPVQIGNRLIGFEGRGAGQEGVVGRKDVRGIAGGLVGDEPVARVAGNRGRILHLEETKPDGVVGPVAGGDGQTGDAFVGGPVVVDQVGQIDGITICAAQSGDSVGQLVASLLIGDLQALIGEESEELVLDDGAADLRARGVAMQLRVLVVGGDVAVLLEEERSGVEPVGSVMEVCAAVEGVGPGLGAHIDVRAGGGSLLCVVHGGVDADLLDGLGRRRRHGVADGQVNRGAAGHNAAAAVVGLARVVDDPEGGDLAGALAVEQVAGVHPIDEEAVGGVALPVGPDGRIAQAAVGAGAAGELDVDAGRKRGNAGKAAGRQGDGFQLGFIQHIAHRGVHGVHQRSRVDGHRRGDLADR